MDHDQTTSADDARPLAGTDAASAPPCSGFVRRDGTWLDAGRTTRDRAARGPRPGRVLIG